MNPTQIVLVENKSAESLLKDPSRGNKAVVNKSTTIDFSFTVTERLH